MCVCERKWVGGPSSFECVCECGWFVEPCFDASIFVCVCVCVGHRLHRMTSIEREEKEKVRKREKKLEEEETMQQATWVKYTFRVKHQVN